MTRMAKMIEVEPQPRIDTLVRLPDGREARRTEYLGTVWLDGKPEVSGLTLRPSRNTPRGLSMPNFAVDFFVPDSLAYQRAALGAATCSVTVALQAAGDTAAITGAVATFTDDPRGAPTWIQLHLQGHVGWPGAIGYRVVALTPPGSVVPAAT